MRLIQSQKRFMLRSLRSSLILKGYIETNEDKSSLITALTVDQANELIESGAISGG